MQCFQCAIIINHHHHVQQALYETTGPGRIMFLPKLCPQLLGDILWEESHSHVFLTHLLYVGEKIFPNYRFGFGPHPFFIIGCEQTTRHYACLFTVAVWMHRDTVRLKTEAKQWKQHNWQTVLSFYCLQRFLTGLTIMPFCLFTRLSFYY